MLRKLIVCSALIAYALPSAATTRFSFAVIPHPAVAARAEAGLREAIRETDADDLAFVVANGIKAADEPCSDALYAERAALLKSAQNGLVVSLAATDWTGCKDENGRSAAIGRLSRLRDLLFPSEFSFGASRIPIMHQSTIPRFRRYAENMRWEIGGIMFATIDLPGDNNHYLFEAGRNSEFEDRVIANRNWLHRLFSYARYQQLKGIVLFADGNPLPPAASGSVRRDGYLETRRQLLALSAQFPGRILVVHNPTGQRRSSSPAILWHDRLGELEAAPPWTKITVDIAEPALFSVAPCAFPPAFPPDYAAH